MRRLARCDYSAAPRLVLSAVVAGQQASRNRVEGHGLAAVARRQPRRRGHLHRSGRLARDSSRLKWKVDVGTGYAAPITVGDRVYAFSRQGEDEVMRALDAATGKTIWETKYNATYKPNPAATRTHGTGPKSTPTFADGRLYTLGMSGVVTAFDAATGKQLWQTAAAEDRTAVSHRDVAARRSRPGDRARRRPQQRRADRVRRAHRRREVELERRRSRVRIADRRRARRHAPGHHDDAGESRRRLRRRPASCCGSVPTPCAPRAMP